MKKWWHEWSVIDLVGLGLGISLALVFVFMNQYYADNNFFQSLLPNIATEVLGVWLSIRIIGRILGRRASYHQLRTDMLQQLYTFSEQARQIFPSPSTVNLRTLETWLHYSVNSLPYREEFLDKSEFIQIQEVHIAATDLVEHLDQYLQVALRISNLYHAIELADIRTNQHREVVEQEILSILIYQARTIKEGLVSVKEYKQRLSLLMEEKAQYFSKQEIAMIEYYINDHLKEDEYTYEGFPDISTRELVRLAVQRIFTFGNDWHRQSKYVAETIERYEDDPHKGFTSQLDLFRKMLEDNSQLVPKVFLDLGWELFETLKAQSNNATELDGAIDTFQQSLYILQENVTFESPLYAK